MRALLALLLVMIASAAEAQAVRIVRTDAMTDKKDFFVYIPSTDEQGSLLMSCGIWPWPALLDDSRAAYFKALTPVMMRFDKDEPQLLNGRQVSKGLLVITVLDLAAFRAKLGSAGRLLLRLDDKSASDVAFDLAADNRGAFRMTALSAGLDAGSAGQAFDVLRETLSRAAAGQYPTAMDLLAAMKTDWRHEGRPRDTGLVIGQVMMAISNTANARTAEDAGQVLFGPAWTAIRPLAIAKGDASYRMLNQGVGRQLAWLADNCPK